MIYTTKVFICNDCFAKEEHYSISSARKHDWAIAQDRYNCYCPKHAPKHRNTGRKKKQMKTNVENH